MGGDKVNILINLNKYISILHQWMHVWENMFSQNIVFHFNNVIKNNTAVWTIN